MHRRGLGHETPRVARSSFATPIQALPQTKQFVCFYSDTVKTKYRPPWPVFCFDVPGKGLEPS